MIFSGGITFVEVTDGATTTVVPGFWVGVTIFDVRVGIGVAVGGGTFVAVAFGVGVAEGLGIPQRLESMGRDDAQIFSAAT